MLVTDVMMPRMDGFEMVRRIREHDKLTPVLFLTARSSVNDVVDGFKMVGDDTTFNGRSLQVFITKLRHRLERDSRLRIVNVRGIGYKLIQA